MTYINWEIKAREFANCNCNYGCPCQFNALPTHGHCEAVAGFQIDEGYFGETRLDGLRAVFIGTWPGAIHEGNGSTQFVIDARADEAQREALLKIMRGEETEPFMTMFNVFAAMAPNRYDPIYTEIQFEVDVDAREARLAVDGMVDSIGEPIRNPVSGAASRARIDLPDGFEYRLAEIGSGTSKVTGTIPLELTASYGQFANIHLSTHGVVD